MIRTRCYLRNKPRALISGMIHINSKRPNSNQQDFEVFHSPTKATINTNINTLCTPMLSTKATINTATPVYPDAEERLLYYLMRDSLR